MSAAGRAFRVAVLLGVCAPLAACDGVQSAFAPFGIEAASLRVLASVMFAAAALITIGVLALAWHAVRADDGIDPRRGMRMVLWLGAVIPTLLLTALLVASLPRMRPLAAAEDGLTIEIDGAQFWWRVVYVLPGGERIETANEVRLPIGRTVTFTLDSPDVIHSFWIPGLAGKVDMIPGRTNTLVAHATATGVYRGVCAEFCGLSHAWMAFDVVSMEPDAFDAWLTRLAAPAVDTEGPGRALFDEHGCQSCHAVRGHVDGTPIGPDLTHFGARASVAAGTLPMSLDSVSRFIRDPRAVKPGALMPAFRRMPPDEADAIAAYLLELR